MRYSIKVKYIAAVTVNKTRVCPDPKRYPDDYQDHRFTYVLAGIETRKWPWSMPVKGCGVFTHFSTPNTWRDTDTYVEVRKSMAGQLTDCLRGYMAGYGDGKDAK